MTNRILHGAPVLWMALILLALCIAGTVAMVAISAVKGADELPAVYHSEGQAADDDLRALALAQRLGLRAQVSLTANGVEVRLTDGSGGAANRDALLLRLTHPSDPSLDYVVVLRNAGNVAYGAIPAARLAAYWQAELRPADSQWLLRGRVGAAGGKLGAAIS
jgi:hypothetical protein